MAYIKPAVQVYQDLANSGGAPSLNPDMPTCIVGELNTIIDVNLSDSLSRTESIGSITLADDAQGNPIWEAATLVTTSASTEVEVYINQASAKIGQIIDEDSYRIYATNPLVKNYAFTGATATSSLEVALAKNTIGDGTAVTFTPLSYFNTVNHVNVGDTVTVTATDGSIIKSTYITDVDTDTGNFGTIHLNSAVELTASDTLTISHKFTSLEVAAHKSSSDDKGHHVLVSDVNPLESSADVTGYTMHAETELETDGVDNLSIYIGYRAQRADLSGRVLTINNITDLSNQLGEISSDNPLAYGISLALANSGGTAIHAIAINPNLSTRDGHTQATELAEAQRIHQLVPLTQELSIQAIYKAHVNAMSLPESGNWRVVMTNAKAPSEEYLLGVPNTADGEDADENPDGLELGTLAVDVITLSTRGATVGKVASGDYVKIVIIGGTADMPTYTYEEVTVKSASGSLIKLEKTPTVAAGSIAFYSARPMVKQTEAEWYAAQARTWIDKRVWMFPGDVAIPNAEGFDEFLPGYYLMAGLAGFISGTPPQQPITNITIGGISDLVHGNFYFTEQQLNIMAEAGALLYCQNAQGTTPYCRHGLATDVSVLEYREVLKIKNWDYLSYYYKDILAPFIGTWNITPDTIQTIRQTLTSASESLLTRKLPKIGGPLISYNISKLEQSATSADAIELIMNIAIVNPTNYINAHLVI